MTTLTGISLTDMISEKVRKYIDGTKLQGGTSISDFKVNFKIADALRKLRFRNVSFFKAEVYYVDIDLEAKGYIFRSKNGKELFISWNKAKKQISELVFKDSSSEFEDEDLLQAMILLEMAEELTDVKSATLVAQLFTEKEVDKSSKEAETLALVVSKIEKAILDGVIQIDKITEDEYEYDDSDLKPVLDEVFKVGAGLTSTVEVEKGESSENEVVSAELIDEETAKPTDEEIYQPSLFEEDTVIQIPQKAKNIKDAQKKKSKKAKEDVVKVIKKVLTREEALDKRKRVSDDAWALAKLRSFGLEESFIRKCMEFRKRQRESLTPEQIMMIPQNVKYTGWTEPIEHGIAAVLTRKNLIIRGETSTGKTTLIKTICAILNYPMTFAGASVDTSIEDLIGINTLEDGNVGVKHAPLITAMKEGALFFLDEGNAALPSVLIKIHSAIDDERIIYDMLTGEEIHAHQNFLFTTCVNDGYEGTNEMNDATLDRLVAIETKYMKSDDLKSYLSDFPGDYSEFQKQVLKMGDVSEDDILILVEIAKAIQAAVKIGTIPEKMGSIRNIIALFDLTRMLSFEKAIKMIVRKYPKEERPALAMVIGEAVGPSGSGLINITAEDILAI